MILYISEERNRIEAILRRRDPTCPFIADCREIVLPDDFNIYVDYTNDEGEPRRREMTAQELLAAMTYREWRAMEYPPIADYVDGIVKGDQAQVDTYLAACQAVKAKYPKPTE
jgi:hypothetical protein